MKSSIMEEQPIRTEVREVGLLSSLPWIRSLGKLTLEVSTKGWRFPAPPLEYPPNSKLRLFDPARAGTGPAHLDDLSNSLPGQRSITIKPPRDMVLLKDRLLYLLQPSLENLFRSRRLRLASHPYPYQMEGIAFLMPRHGALLADEMGLGKTVQAILALRLLFHAGLIRNALIVCPKPLVHNWSRELRCWAEELPFEVVGGDVEARSSCWTVSNCPLKLVNYELLTRDAEVVCEGRVRFDVVVLDEAQRIKNRDSKTARVVRSIQRQRSWALTGTPVENKPDDLISLFAFVDPDRIPANASPKQLPALTADCVLRRNKDDVLTELPPKTVQDTFVELTSAQRSAYDMAERDGVIRLNTLGDTITVQHVFELVMRLKQICNFDPLTGHSAKLTQLHANLTEVAESGRKAIVFSQWVEPLIYLARALESLGPLQFHGRVPPRERPQILQRFRNDPSKHVLLMSYGTGSVGLNLQFANYVFLFDRWWNPAVEDQAINRVHRIGQKEPVFVTRYVTPGTVEERIADILERKRQLFNELIEQNGTPPALGMSEEEIFSLFDIRVRPKRMAA